MRSTFKLILLGSPLRNQQHLPRRLSSGKCLVRFRCLIQRIRVADPQFQSPVPIQSNSAAVRASVSSRVIA